MPSDNATGSWQGALWSLATAYGFAPYGFDDHATHHRFPGVPYYRLPWMTQAQWKADPNAAELEPVGSHAQLLWKFLR